MPGIPSGSVASWRTGRCGAAASGLGLELYLFGRGLWALADSEADYTNSLTVVLCMLQPGSVLQCLYFVRWAGWIGYLLDLQRRGKLGSLGRDHARLVGRIVGQRTPCA